MLVTLLLKNNSLANIDIIYIYLSSNEGYGTVLGSSRFIKLVDLIPTSKEIKLSSSNLIIALYWNKNVQTL